MELEIDRDKKLINPVTGMPVVLKKYVCGYKISGHRAASPLYSTVGEVLAHYKVQDEGTKSDMQYLGKVRMNVWYWAARRMRMKTSGIKVRPGEYIAIEEHRLCFELDEI